MKITIEKNDEKMILEGLEALIFLDAAVIGLEGAEPVGHEQEANDLYENVAAFFEKTSDNLPDARE